MPDLTHLKHALAVRAISRAAPENPIVGAPLAVLRADARIGVHDDHPAAGNATAVYDEIMAITVDDMPASTDLVAILLETAVQRHNDSWAGQWRAIGINPNRGRDFMTRRAQAIDWPIWFTLRHRALA